MRLALKLGAATALLGMVVAFAPAANAVDQNLPAYQASPGIAGQITSVGSDTLGNAVALWAKGFEGLYPGAKIMIEAKGSATAPPALLEGRSQFGPMSRPMTAEELDAFQKKFGYPVTSFRVAVDALAVYVNKDNPIACLTTQEVKRIFSTNRVSAFGPDIHSWGDAGVAGEFESQPIVLFGRNNISGTYEFFKQIALSGGEYKPEITQEPGSEAVVQNVASNRFAIGYSGIGYKTDGVRAVPLALFPGATCYDTSAEATYSGRYPLARYLYIYVNKSPNQPIDPLAAEFIKYIQSKDGQLGTEKSGFYPITNKMREEDLKRLGIAVTQ